MAARASLDDPAHSVNHLSSVDDLFFQKRSGLKPCSPTASLHENLSAVGSTDTMRQWNHLD
jgi:hypothetical protein